MFYKIKNKTSSQIEIFDIGKTILPEEVVEISNYEFFFSEDLSTQISFGNLVVVSNTGQEFTEIESQDLLNSVSSPEKYIDLSNLEELKIELQSIMDQKISDIVGGAPAAWDTLQEIANALNDNTDFQTWVTNELSNKSALSHSHDERYYQKDEINSQLSSKSDIAHEHLEFYDVDSVNTLLSGKSNLNHTHSDYYTKQTTDSLLNLKSNSNHNHDDIYALKDSVNDNIVFGKNFHSFESNAIITTLDSDFTVHDEWLVTLQDAGMYRIGWQFFWNISKKNKDFVSKIEVYDADNNFVSKLFEINQKVTGDDGEFGSTGSAQKYQQSGFKYVQLNESGLYRIKLLVFSDYKNTVASTWDRQIEIWRVS